MRKISHDGNAPVTGHSGAGAAAGADDCIPREAASLALTSGCGPVFSDEMLELQPKARIEGNVQYSALEMHQGALIAGQLRPLVAGEEKPALKLAANNA